MKHPLPVFLGAGAVPPAGGAGAPAPGSDDPPPPPAPVVIEAEHLERILATHERTVGRPATEAERASLVDAEVRDALLLRAARDSGLDRIDPRISWRLMEKMRFLGKADEDDPAATVRLARALGLDQHDVVIERMLVEKMGTVARYRARAEHAIDEVQLQAFFDEHSDRWLQPRTTTLSHAFFAGTDQAGRRRASDALARIGADDQGSQGHLTFGDPFVAGRHLEAASDQTLAKLFGESFPASVSELPERSWQGPVASALGWHLVFVESRREARTPALEEVRRQVVAAFEAERGEAGLARLIEDLRKVYEVRIESGHSDARSSAVTRSAPSVAAPPQETARG